MFRCPVRVAAVLSLIGWTVWAQSPFALTVERAAFAQDHADVRVSVTVPEKHLVYVNAFKVTADSGAVVTPLRLPPAEEEPDPADPSKRVKIYARSFESLWRIAPCKDGLRLSVAYQGCSAQTCFMPETHVFRFNAATGAFAAEGESPDTGIQAPDGGGWADGFTVTTDGGYMGAEAFLAFLDRAEGKETKAIAGGTGLAGFLRDPVSFFHAHGLMLTLLLVLLGGVLLNLTPCVLPMIPINLAIIGAGAGTRGRGFGLGAAYGVGIVLVYGGLGWVILRSGLFFGALQASPWFSLSVALIFAVLALALFDVFTIDFARFMTPKGGSARQGVAAAFSAGVFSALLAGACVAPVVLAVLLLAGTLYAGGAKGAQFLPFVLGLGMALPWPFAGAGLSVLPSPGMWMVRVKQIFGVLVALLAAYYFYLAAVGFLPAARVAREGSIAAGDRAAWTEKIAQAKQGGKPVFVDFWATWCKNCSAMEKTTFRNERVKARLAGYAIVKVQAEKPEQSPAKEMLAAFGVRGLPGFAVLR